MKRQVNLLPRFAKHIAKTKPVRPNDPEVMRSMAEWTAVFLRRYSVEMQEEYIHWLMGALKR